MRKEELVRRVAERAGVAKKTARQVLEAFCEEAAEALCAGEIVPLGRKFGSFVVVERAARRGRNPRTGETIQIPARKAVKFGASRALRRRINGEG
ncbi:MAG: HU family DNA-binding protein [Thermodesulfatator sp.]|nr:MAG: HU family DNA-binding protein [Thermodesulfatator sp.]